MKLKTRYKVELLQKKQNKTVSHTRKKYRKIKQTTKQKYKEISNKMWDKT